MTDDDEPVPLEAAEAASVVRGRRRRDGMRQYRTIFLLSAYWSMATLLLAMAGSVLHFFEIGAACADILHTDGAVNTRVAFSPPGVVVVCAPASAPTDAVEAPMATTAGVIVWAGLGVLASAGSCSATGTCASRSTAAAFRCDPGPVLPVPRFYRCLGAPGARLAKRNASAARRRPLSATRCLRGARSTMLRDSPLGLEYGREA